MNYPCGICDIYVIGSLSVVIDATNGIIMNVQNLVIGTLQNYQKMILNGTAHVTHANSVTKK